MYIFCCNLYHTPFRYDFIKTVMKNLNFTYNNYWHTKISSTRLRHARNSPFRELLGKYVYRFGHRLETCDKFTVCGIDVSLLPLQPAMLTWWRDIYQDIYRNMYMTGFTQFFISDFNVNVYVPCIFCKPSYGMCFRNKHLKKL